MKFRENVLHMNILVVVPEIMAEIKTTMNIAK